MSETPIGGQTSDATNSPTGTAGTPTAEAPRTPPRPGPAPSGFSQALETRLFYGLLVLCAVSLLANFIIEKDGGYPVEHLFGFYGLTGLVGTGLVILAGRALRRVLSQPEDYYDQ